MENLKRFISNGSAITLWPTKKEFKVASGIEDFFPWRVYTDYDFENLLGGITVRGRKNRASYPLFKFKKNLTPKQKSRICKKPFYRRKNVFDALEISRKIIVANKVREPNTSLIIFLRKYKRRRYFIAVGKNCFGRYQVYLFRRKKPRVGMFKEIVGFVA